MTQGTCAVTIHGSLDHDRPDRPRGLVQYRAHAEGCGQHAGWRDTITEAEQDAQRMDAHQCPERFREDWTRLLPKAHLRTKTSALLTETVLRYMPWLN